MKPTIGIGIVRTSIAIGVSAALAMAISFGIAYWQEGQRSHKVDGTKNDGESDNVDFKADFQVEELESKLWIVENVDINSRMITLSEGGGTTSQFKFSGDIDLQRTDRISNDLKSLQKGERARFRFRALDGAMPLVDGLVGGLPKTATHVEVEPIRMKLGLRGKLETIAMDNQGRLIAAVSWATGKYDPVSESRGRYGPREYAIQILAPDGKIIDSKPMKGLAPKAIHACEDGTFYVAGAGHLAKLAPSGKLLRKVKLAEVLDGVYAESDASGITVSDQYLFVAFGVGLSLRATEDIVRFDRELGSPAVIIKKQFGCCSHIDVDVTDGVLLIAENSRHRVNRFSFDGELLARWGKRDRGRIEGFGACCNPVNFDVGPGGTIYTAESGLGRVKRYSAEGTFLDVVGYVDTTQFVIADALAGGACYIPIEVAKDGKRVYVMDVKANVIRVLVEKVEKE